VKANDGWSFEKILKGIFERFRLERPGTIVLKRTVNACTFFFEQLHSHARSLGLGVTFVVCL
jgi:hypothetical protein